MGYVYSVMWFIIAFILIFKMSKENKVFYLGGAFFIFFGIWFLLDTMYPAFGMFSGTLGFVFRAIALVVLIIMCMVFFKERKKTDSENKN